MAKNISEQLLKMLQDAKERSGAVGSLSHYRDHFLENGHGTALEAELAYMEMIENPEPKETRRDVASKPLSPIAARKAARSKQPVEGANAANTVRPPKR